MSNNGYDKSAEFYDYFDKKENIDFFCSYALRAREALDVGAGTGRISIPIMEKGIKVWCVESSPKMLQQFLMKLDAKPELERNVELIKADASSFKIKRKFKFVFMSGVFDHFLTKEEREKVLVNIYNHMEKEGVLIFDIFLGLMKDSSIKPAGIYVNNEKEYKRHVGAKVLEDNKIEVTLIYEIFEKNKLVDKVEEKSFAAILNKDEVIQLVKDIGFEILNMYSNYDFTTFKTGDNILIIEAQKVN